MLKYLKGIFEVNPELKPDFVFCTGDIAFGEVRSDPLSEQYVKAKEFFDKILTICGKESVMPKERLFLVPGNHDIDRSNVNADAQAMYKKFSCDSENNCSKINSRFNEKSIEFKDAIRRLDQYGEFIKEYLPHQYDAEGRYFYAQNITVHGITVGIAGFNSAWTCAGEEDDRNLWLAAEWQFNSAASVISNADIRVGLIHHPMDWFNTAERNIVSRRISTDFDYWLHGHTHNSWVAPGSTHIVVGAGAVGAEMSEEFGINLTTVNFDECTGVTRLHAKKSSASGWMISPVPSHAPTGEWCYSLPTRIAEIFYQKGEAMTREMDLDNSSRDGLISRYFSRKLEDSLRSFSSHSNSWVDRILSTASETEKNSDLAEKINFSELIKNPKSALIKAPPQYGLTCLSHKIVLEAWNSPLRSLFLYLDARNLQPHKSSIEQATSDELQMLGRTRSEINCVILDSFDSDEKNMVKMLKNVSIIFSGIPLVVMMKMSSGSFNLTSIDIEDRKFEEYYLWTIGRSVIRNIVAAYNEVRKIGDEDTVTARITSDLSVLNLHRTPINCITLLKVSEAEFDESPVNRCDVIRRVLFLLFNVDTLPSYKSKPDLKDCEYVLGSFCEGLLRSGNHLFARDKFLSDAQAFCKDKLIDLETSSVFDILYQNNIIIKIGHFFRFKSSYWIFYFSAQRMYHDEEFANFILSDMRYSLYPEVVEFYTGIDRRRNNALEILINDLSKIHQQVQNQCGLPFDVNPYRYSLWNSSEATREKMEKEIAEGVKESNLPVAIKDQYADKLYDKSKPYQQEIKNVLGAHNFSNMQSVMSAGARALRNSDYASTDVKKRLLKEIMNCWHQTTRVLFVILPLLAKEGYAAYDGAAFALGDGFGTEPNERLLRILVSIPYNVSCWVQDDLYSRKMGPLLLDQLFGGEIGEIEKHELVLILISYRPKNWDKAIQRYISECGKSSFYLMDTYQALRTQYRIGYFSDAASLSTVEHLIKLAAAKHVTGQKLPNEKSLKNLKGDFIPDRIV
ncbi:metallophosphoesterase family protein [Janthinobacterium sp. HLX7-2]|uniref:metallophosphoesterase family protein n=1 Tax=Janthinobacterium sp. HLX7-2 TaxID=1259331 RepID=UPI003F1E6DFA